MQYGTQIGSLLTRAETQRLVQTGNANKRNCGASPSLFGDSLQVDKFAKAQER